MTTGRITTRRARRRATAGEGHDTTSAGSATSSGGSASNGTGPGATDGADTDEGGRQGGWSRLPALTQSTSEYSAPAMLRYSDIPNDLAEALRGIINRYELRAGTALPKSIAVTSALAGEGTTTVSQALATMIAQEMGAFVCWVDCSWLIADAAQLPGKRPNLIEILTDQSRILSAFQGTEELPQLMCFAPGPVPESKRNMIVRSPEFERLLGVLAEEFDHVVLDIPPVLTSVNGLALLRHADASLLVVQHRSTTLAQVERAVEATQPTPNLGVVLNRYRTRIPVRLRRLIGG